MQLSWNRERQAARAREAVEVVQARVSLSQGRKCNDEEEGTALKCI